MIDDETHPEMVRAFHELTAALSLIHRHRRGAVNLEYYQQVMQARDLHRTAWRLRGVDFPRLVLVGLSRLNVVELWRADLTLPNIRIKVVNLVRAYPTVTSREIVAALRAAYPDIRPGDLTRSVMTYHYGDKDDRESERGRKDLERENHDYRTQR